MRGALPPCARGTSPEVGGSGHPLMASGPTQPFTKKPRPANRNGASGGCLTHQTVTEVEVVEELGVGAGIGRLLRLWCRTGPPSCYPAASLASAAWSMLASSLFHLEGRLLKTPM